MSTGKDDRPTGRRLRPKAGAGSLPAPRSCSSPISASTRSRRWRRKRRPVARLAHRDHRLADHLHRLYIVVAAVFTGVDSPIRCARTGYATEQAEPLTMALTARRLPMPNGRAASSPSDRWSRTPPCCSCFSLDQPRIFFSMARDGLLPPVFAKVHPTVQTPHITTILTGVFVGGFAAVESIDEMVDLTNIGTLFAFILFVSASSFCVTKSPNRTRPFRSSLWRLAAAVDGRRLVSSF